MKGQQKQTDPEIVEVDKARLDEIVEHAKAGRVLSPEECALMQATFGSFCYLTELVRQKKISIARLQKLLFGASTEKTESVIGSAAEDAPGEPSLPADEDEANDPGAETDRQDTPAKPRKGHGRNGADAYHGAEKVEVPHESLQPGDACPECGQGTVYQLKQPATLVRLVGQTPVHGKVYELERLRCNLCGKVFTAQAPEGVGTKKYDDTVAAMIGLLKYGSGMPFNRLEGLQGNVGIPLPASTQWQVVRDGVANLYPAYRELVRQAAQGDVVYNDDTKARILDRMGKRLAKSLAQQASVAAESGKEEDDSERRGLFTSGIVSTCADHRIALFFTGWKHAGENLLDVLARRDEPLGPPIQMCDALSRNMPAELNTILSNCLVHGRRNFVDVAEHFPQECRHVLKALKVVYKNDADAREQNLSPEARLQFHQANSGPVMEALHEWLTRQIDDRLVEPNSGLGQAIAYMLKHWPELTLFLRQAGAPLDNNLCERALKKAILHRKNALFYKTDNGARVGDIYMSLIHTCELCHANPLDYLTELLRHPDEVSASPESWMPWNYRRALDGLTVSASPETTR